MSDQPLTSGEFVRTMNAFGERIDRLTVQVERTNGRVGQLETSHAVHGQKVVNLERQVFRVEMDTPTSEVKDDASRPLTRWDLGLFVAGAYVLIEFGPKLAAIFGGPKP